MWPRHVSCDYIYVCVCVWSCFSLADPCWFYFSCVCVCVWIWTLLHADIHSMIWVTEGLWVLMHFLISCTFTDSVEMNSEWITDSMSQNKSESDSVCLCCCLPSWFSWTVFLFFFSFIFFLLSFEHIWTVFLLSVCLSQIRYRKDKVQSKQTPVFVVVSGVKDLSNGCAIAAALHFYCPQILPLEGKTHTFIYQSKRLTETLKENYPHF